MKISTDFPNKSVFNNDAQRAKQIDHIGIGELRVFHFILSRVKRVAGCILEVGFFQVAIAEFCVFERALRKIGFL